MDFGLVASCSRDCSSEHLVRSPALDGREIQNQEFIITPQVSYPLHRTLNQQRVGQIYGDIGQTRNQGLTVVAHSQDGDPVAGTQICLL
jgi:hypothetical protein